MPKLKFESGKNTQLVTFKVDPETNKKLTAIRTFYSKEARMHNDIMEDKKNDR